MTKKHQIAVITKKPSERQQLHSISAHSSVQCKLHSDLHRSFIFLHHIIYNQSQAKHKLRKLMMTPSDSITIACRSNVFSKNSKNNSKNQVRCKQIMSTKQTPNFCNTLCKVNLQVTEMETGKPTPTKRKR